MFLCCELFLFMQLIHRYISINLHLICLNPDGLVFIEWKKTNVGDKNYSRGRRKKGSVIVIAFSDEIKSLMELVL